MIIALENAKYELINFRENIKELGDALKISELKVEVENLPEMESVNDINLLDRLKEASIIDTLSKMPSYLKYVFSGSKTYNQMLVLMDSTDPNSSG